MVLVEKEDRLGGMANRPAPHHRGLGRAALPAGPDRPRDGPTRRIQVLTRALIVGFSGFKGNFTTEVLVGPGHVRAQDRARRGDPGHRRRGVPADGVPLRPGSDGS
ncbi:MAG: hypothetical protein MZU91_08135 [Desulfosudis oleivorans]|nr:hypothetical protein [Desulfosudis oleivorans]